jgi:hypothetical protein
MILKSQLPSDVPIITIFACCILLRRVRKNVYFVFQSVQQFIKSIQMNYLHEGRISEAQHVFTPNGSLSGSDSTQVPNLYLIWIHIIGLFFVLILNLLQGPQS